jgi:Tfp pilus assembly protein PilO
METKNREKLLLIVIGGCAALWLLDVIVISPLFGVWDAREKTIADTRKKIADGKVMMERAPDLEKRWKSMRDNTLPSNLTLAESQLFNVFDVWGRTSGVALVGQKPEKKDSDSEDYQNMEWRADVTGNNQQIANFLYRVESSPLALKVESVELSSRDERGSQLALGLTVSGLILTPTNSFQQ